MNSMALRIIKYETTPNPHALKCVLSGSISEGMKAFRTREAASGDPAAASLFGVTGVSGLLFNGSWMTVSKAPDAGWPAVKAGVEAALGTL